MPAAIIDGKALAESIRAAVAGGVRALEAERGVKPGFAAVLVGDDPASHTYVSMKSKAMEAAGIRVKDYLLPASVSQGELLALIGELNADAAVDGILVQLPLPKPLDSGAVLREISPDKDVDGLHPLNLGRLLAGEEGFVPCTPHGVLKMIESTGVPIEGSRAVVVGRSNIVGKPMALLLLQRHATVTLCHSRTRDPGAVCREADILVAAAGSPRLVKGDWIKPGAVVIDVGTNRVEGSKKLVGDVDFEAAKEVAGWLSPVPGGVGPMTITMLLWNTLESARRRAPRGA